MLQSDLDENPLGRPIGKYREKKLYERKRKGKWYQEAHGLCLSFGLAAPLLKAAKKRLFFEFKPVCLAVHDDKQTSSKNGNWIKWRHVVTFSVV